MTDSIFARPGVVDAIDVHGRPMLVPLPEQQTEPDPEPTLRNALWTEDEPREPHNPVPVRWVALGLAVFWGFIVWFVRELGSIRGWW